MDDRIEICSDAPGLHVVILAGVHGDEYEPMLAASELAQRLPELLVAGKVTVVPVVNQSAYGLAGRCGADQLDLARICPGKPDGSISEKAAFRISSLVRTADYLVDMHTGGMVHDICPMAGYLLHPDAGILEKQKRMALMFSMPVIWGTDPLPNGRTLSVARDANIPAVYLEYGGGSGLRKEVITKYLEGVLNLLRDLKMIAGAAVVPPVEKIFWVEDFNNDSGSFQSKMPSPAGGIFVTAQQPGAMVKKGALFGKVAGPETGGVVEVAAPFDGIVLAVRVAVRVQPGDALGAILPVTEPGMRTIQKGMEHAGDPLTT
ncbi:succinylglutamate desuccinylase/aspartoacylase family protein [Niabella aurantiaca]|uniref:succinylglutamate desuccinylase/aspartoacylase family protein n=1 Tax=Niabella aurantiaca TaxID=379900 RepID=UPI001B7FD4F5|nr:M14 family metallopeptidase [Niabella aurantiaca]